MPSVHSSCVVALMVAAGVRVGWDTPIFAVSFILAMVVMYDAAGVRRAAGRQAKAINNIIKSLQKTHTIPEKEMKELLGHTPVEVIAGALLGATIAVFMFHYNIV